LINTSSPAFCTLPEDRGHPELPADDPQVLGTAFVLHRRGARDDLAIADVGELGQDQVLHAGDEIFVVLVVREVLERQHRDGFGGNRRRLCRGRASGGILDGHTRVIRDIHVAHPAGRLRRSGLQSCKRSPLRCIRATGSRYRVPGGSRLRSAAPEVPQQSAADCEHQCDQQQFGTGDPVLAALAVVPREQQRKNEAQGEHPEGEVHHGPRPGIAVGNDFEHLDQRERSGDVRDRPLHQLALPQALQPFVHDQSLPDSPSGCVRSPSSAPQQARRESSRF
jgi:hypothetical protein